MCSIVEEWLHNNDDNDIDRVTLRTDGYISSTAKGWLYV